MQFRLKAKDVAIRRRRPTGGRKLIFPISRTASQATIAECYLGAFQTMWPH